MTAASSSPAHEQVHIFALSGTHELRQQEPYHLAPEPFTDDDAEQRSFLDAEAETGFFVELVGVVYLRARRAVQ